MRYNTALLLCATFLASAPAFAQASEASGEAAAAAEAGLQDIVVTAQRRSERLQDVPIAVSALSAEVMDKAQVRNVIEVQNISPSVVMNRLGNALVPFIRGVGSLDGTVGQESAVAIYVDGVYRPAPFIANVDFNNIERVEVLKGPQGTLFGRNATGGAIQIITRDPSTDPSVAGSIAFGNYKTVDGRFYATGGLGENVAADLAVTYHNQVEGFGTNIATGHDIYRDRNFAARSKLQYDSRDRLKLTFAGEYMNLRNESDGRHAFPGHPLIDGSTYTGNYWNVNSSVDALYKAEGWGLSGRVDYSLDALDLVSITAYQRAHLTTDWDQDGTPLPIVDVFMNKAVFRTFTQEVQILSPSDSKVKWIVGGFFMRNTSGFVDPNGILLVGSAVGGALSRLSTIYTKSYSAFGEVTVPLGENTRVTAGARWSRDERRVKSSIRFVNPANFSTISRIVNPTFSANFSKPTWRVILDHHLNPDVMVYASVSRGFKSGNFSALTPTAPPFKPEVLTAYEAGIKSDLLDRHLRLNVSGFYYRYDDMQLPIYIGTVLSTQNAGKSEVAGGEIEGQAIFGGGFELGFGAGFLYSKFLSFANGICYLPNPAGGDLLTSCDHTGDRLPKTPKLTFNISPSYTVQVGSGSITANMTYFHSSSYRFEPNADNFQSSYDLLSARLGWTSADEHLGFAIFGKNLTKEKYAQFAIAQIPGSQYSAAPPRTYGVEASFKF